MTFDFNEEKLMLVVAGILVTGAVALASAHWVSIQNVYSTFVSGCVSLVGIYCGSNLAHKWIDGKQSNDESKGDSP